MPEPEIIFWRGVYLGEFTATGVDHGYIDGELVLPASETQTGFLEAYDTWVQKYPDKRERLWPVKPGFPVLEFESGCLIVFDLSGMRVDSEDRRYCQIFGKRLACRDIYESKNLR